MLVRRTTSWWCWLGAATLGLRPCLALPWNAKAQGAHLMSLCLGRAGEVWAGTEDLGVWRWQPHAGHGAGETGAWRQYTTRDGLGDDHGYALACDRRGRVWVGHLNHGVSVFDGTAWRNYDCLTGPLGDRLHGLAVAPEGDVWMATSGSLTRYVDALDTWVEYTVADGLPSNQFTCVAVDRSGTVYAGSACDGLAVGRVDGGRYVWRTVPGPTERPLVSAVRHTEWLPSALINDVHVGPSGMVYVATSYGLAWSYDGGRTWAWARGADWAEHVRGRLGGAPKDWRPDAPGPLKEDYCTCVREDAQRRIWVGHWRAGWRCSTDLGSSASGSSATAATATSSVRCSSGQAARRCWRGTAAG